MWKIYKFKSLLCFVKLKLSYKYDTWETETSRVILAVVSFSKKFYFILTYFKQEVFSFSKKNRFFQARSFLFIFRPLVKSNQIKSNQIICLGSPTIHSSNLKWIYLFKDEARSYSLYFIDQWCLLIIFQTKMKSEFYLTKENFYFLNILFNSCLRKIMNNFESKIC